MDFIIDTVGNNAEFELENEEETSNSNIQNAEKKSEHPLAYLFESETEHVKPPRVCEKPENLFEKLVCDGLSAETKTKILPLLDHAKKREKVNALLAKSTVLNPEFNSQFSIGDLNISEKKLRKQRKEERERTKGAKWFGLPATEMTPEIKKDLEILQMRSVLDPKRFYKKNDNKALPKYFQIGKVMDNPLDYYNNRLTKKERKKSLVDELMADAQFRKYNKMKYAEIITEKQKTHYKAWRQAKKLKKRKN